MKRLNIIIDSIIKVNRKVSEIVISFLEQTRAPKNDLTTSKKIINTILIFILGISLGIFSKWLDNMVVDNNIWWKYALDTLDLRNIFSMLGVWILIAVSISVFSSTPLRSSINVFIFFLGMNVSYHMYTVVFAGFNPMSYMMIWYTIMLLSPFMAFICWYAKGFGIISFIINIAIIAVMTLCSFSLGMWYFYFTNAINTIFFIITLVVLYDTPKKSIYSLISAIVLAYLLRLFI